MRTFVVAVALSGIVHLTAAPPGHAETPAIPALSFVEAAMMMDERPVPAGAVTMVLGESALLRTQTGRAVVDLTNGRLVLGAETVVRIDRNRPFNFNGIQIVRGSALLLTHRTGGAGVTCENDLHVSSAGVFRFDATAPSALSGGGECRLRVYEGAAAVQLATLTTALRAGETMHLNRQCGDMLPVFEFPVSERDDLQIWSAQMARLSPSSGHDAAR